MNEVIKDFIAMMERNANNKWGALCSDIAKGQWHRAIMKTYQYTALKALSEQKIVVTDEMVKVAVQKWFGRKLRDDEVRVPEYRASMIAALEAVFDMVNNPSVIEKNGIKYTFTDDAIYVDTKLDDGWIEWRRLSCPDLPIETRIEVKSYSGEIVENFVGCAKRNFNWDNIIAYRIILEPVSAEIAPTPKQTLLDAFYEGQEVVEEKEYKTIRKISEYLEGLK